MWHVSEKRFASISHSATMGFCHHYQELGVTLTQDISNNVKARQLSGRHAERPRHEPPAALPLALRTVERSNISAGRFDQPSSKRILLIKWVIGGEAVMEMHGQRFHFGPGDVAV